MGEISMIGLDLAKNVFQVHGVDASGAVVLRRQLRRGQVVKFFAQQAPTLVGMEACAGAHHWARVIGEQGPPGSSDAAVLCEALREAEQE
jgi:transposase